ncbi:MAG TPA: hypothetical protein VMS22_03370 [Candidatus Eisenbacteria bacterium]|nr:hypothetical protein [Candidatus Eisenbacteria bacterium]
MTTRRRLLLLFVLCARLRIIGMWLAGQPDFLVASVEPLAEP